MEANELATKQDLVELRQWLSERLEQFSTGSSMPTILRTRDIVKKLGVSLSTIQTLRNNGTLPFTKVNGTIYYNWDDIEKVLFKQAGSK